jgi:hypothetical protein
MLKNVVVYVLLAPHGNEQWDQVHRIHAIRQMELIPEYNTLLELFINEEIIHWKDSILQNYEKLLRHGTPASAAPPSASDFSIIRLILLTSRFLHRMRMGRSAGRPSRSASLSTTSEWSPSITLRSLSSEWPSCWSFRLR